MGRHGVFSCQGSLTLRDSDGFGKFACLIETQGLRSVTSSLPRMSADFNHRANGASGNSTLRQWNDKIFTTSRMGWVNDHGQIVLVTQHSDRIQIQQITGMTIEAL